MTSSLACIHASFFIDKVTLQRHRDLPVGGKFCETTPNVKTLVAMGVLHDANQRCRHALRRQLAGAAIASAVVFVWLAAASQHPATAADVPPPVAIAKIDALAPQPPSASSAAASSAAAAIDSGAAAAANRIPAARSGTVETSAGPVFFLTQPGAAAAAPRHNGEQVLLLHGAAYSSATWEKVSERKEERDARGGEKARASGARMRSRRSNRKRATPRAAATPRRSSLSLVGATRRARGGVGALRGGGGRFGRRGWLAWEAARNDQGARDRWLRRHRGRLAGVRGATRRDAATWPMVKGDEER